MDNRGRTKYYMNLISLSVTCLILVALLFIAISRIRTLMGEVDGYESRIAAQAGEDKLYSAAEVEELRRKDRRDSANMERARIQTQIRSELLGGESMTETLRGFYSDELVVEDRGGYGFAAVYETIPHNVFTDESFIPDEEGDPVYAGEAGVADFRKGIRVSSENGEIAWSRVPVEEYEAALIRAGFFDENGAYAEDAFFYGNVSAALSYEMNVIPYYQLSDDTETEEALAGCRDILERLSDYEGETEKLLFVLLPGQVRGQRRDMTDLVASLSGLLAQNGYRMVLGGDIAALTLSVQPTELSGIKIFLQQKKDPMYFPYRFSYWEYESERKVFGIPGETGQFYLIDYIGQI